MPALLNQPDASLSDEGITSFAHDYIFANCLTRQREHWPYLGLVYRPVLLEEQSSTSPLSVVELLQVPQAGANLYEFEPPFSLAGQVVMRLEGRELPDIDWEY